MTGSGSGQTGAAPAGPHRPEARDVPVGDPPASFGDLYLGSFSAMVRLARVLVDSPETAEDLVQDAFVHLHRHWGGVRDPRAYLHRSVVNACRSHHRRAWRERSRLGARRRRPGAGPEQRLWRSRWPTWSSTVRPSKAAPTMPMYSARRSPPWRTASAPRSVLRYYADLPDAEIAVALGCRPGTVASLVHRGLERLREVVDHD